MDVGSTLPKAPVYTAPATTNPKAAAMAKASEAKTAEVKAAKSDASANNDARDYIQYPGQTQGWLKGGISDPDPMRTVVLNKLASGTQPTEFAGEEAKAFGRLSTTEIAEAQKAAAANAASHYDRTASFAKSDRAAGIDIGNKMAAEAGGSSASAPDPTKMAPPVAPLPAPVAPAPVAPAPPVVAPVPPPVPVAGPVAAVQGREPSKRNLMGAEMPSGADIAKLPGDKLGMTIGDLLDIIGSGFAGAAGRDSPTRRRQQEALKMQAQAEAQKAQMVGEIELKNKLAAMPEEARMQLELAEKTGDIQARNAILIANAIQPLELEKARAGKLGGMNGATLGYLAGQGK